MSKRNRKKKSINGEKIVLVESPMTPLVDDNGYPRSRSLESNNNRQLLQSAINPCEVCPAKCCNHLVVLSLPDAIEFCQTLGIPFLSGLRFSPSQNGATKTAFLMDHDSRLNPECQPDEWPGTANITLPRHNNGSCKMLVDIGGYKRCGVYSVRPSACRTYPMTYEVLGVRTGSVQISCPTPFPIDATTEKELKDVALSAEKKWHVHMQVIKEWEAFEPDDGRTVENFLLFSIPRAAQLSGLPFYKVIFPGKLS